MSTTDEDIGLSAEEQAQFDAMRDSALPPGSNIQSPDQLTPPADAASAASDETSTAVDKSTAPAEELEDGVETVKDPSGKDVVDPNTSRPQKRVSFHKYQRAMERMAELEGVAV